MAILTHNNNLPKVILYLVLVTLLIYSTMSHWAYDDPFITYRYSQNITAGRGFVYNPGEQILSTTTPLFALLLAILSYLWTDLPYLANLIGAFSLALGGIFLWDLGRSWNTPLVGWVGLLLYPTFPLLLSTLGSETPLYLALCMGAFVFYARKKYSLTAILAALAILTRPDGVLVPAVLGAHYLLRTQRAIPWSAIVIFLGLTLPWLIFSWLYFGSPIPATLATKQNQGEMVISQRFAPGFLTVLRWYSGRWHYCLEAGLMLLGLIYMFRKARQWILLLSWTALYFIAYSILGVSRYFWYYAPIVPGFISAVGLGVSAIFNGLQSYITPSTRRFSTFGVVALLIVLFLAQVNHLQRLSRTPDPRASIYKSVGEWLQAETPINSTVAALEVGIIGYYAQRPMVDFAGLIQPNVASQLTTNTTYEDAARWASDYYHPDYIILHEGFFSSFEREFIFHNCQMVRHFPGDEYKYEKNINIYSCN